MPMLYNNPASGRPNERSRKTRLTPHSRAMPVRHMLEGGLDAAKWFTRLCTEGIAGLQDRSSRPHKLRHPTPRCIIRRIEALWHQRWTGQRIATELGISPFTVSRTLHRSGWAGSRISTPSRRPIAMSAADPTRGSTSTSRSWHASRPPDIESPDDTPACTEAVEPDGNTCPSASTTIPPWLSPL